MVRGATSATVFHVIGDIISIDVPPLLLPGVGGTRDPLREYRAAVVKQLLEVTADKHVLLIAEPPLVGIRPAPTVAAPSEHLQWADQHAFLNAPWHALYGTLGMDLASPALTDAAAHLPPADSARLSEGLELPRSLGSEILRFLLATAFTQNQLLNVQDATGVPSFAATVSTSIGPPREGSSLPSPLVVLIARHTLSAHADGLAPSTEHYEHDIHDWLSTLDKKAWRITTMTAPLPAGLAHV